MRWKCRRWTRASLSPWTCAECSTAPVIKDIFMPLRTVSSHVKKQGVTQTLWDASMRTSLPLCRVKDLDFFSVLRWRGHFRRGPWEDTGDGRTVESWVKWKGQMQVAAFRSSFAASFISPCSRDYGCQVVLGSQNGGRPARGTLSVFHHSLVPILSLKRETIGVFTFIILPLIPFDLPGLLLALCKEG